VDSELHFEWPNHVRRTLSEPSFEWRPLARRKADRLPPVADSDRLPSAEDEASGAHPLPRELDDARDTIARLEADRRAARIRIDELEAARELLQTRVTSQRRRLLLLERQLEDANVEPAAETRAAVSWFDRLFGGPSSVPIP
jgi:hypothetical protein